MPGVTAERERVQRGIVSGAPRCRRPPEASGTSSAYSCSSGIVRSSANGSSTPAESCSHDMPGGYASRTQAASRLRAYDSGVRFWTRRLSTAVLGVGAVVDQACVTVGRARVRRCRSDQRTRSRRLVASTVITKLLALADAPALSSPTTAPPVRAATASLEMRSNSNAAYGAQTRPWIDSCLLLPESVLTMVSSPRARALHAGSPRAPGCRRCGCREACPRPRRSVLTRRRSCFRHRGRRPRR